MVPVAVPRGEKTGTLTSLAAGPGIKKQGVSGESANHSAVKGTDYKLEKHDKDFR